MMSTSFIAEAAIGCVLILSSLGVILAKKPVSSCLSFLVTLLSLAALYLQLSAEFIATMQVLVYAGAILVLFMFVIVLFQDAYKEIAQFSPKSSILLIFIAACSFLLSFILFGRQLLGGLISRQEKVFPGFGTVESLGKILYLDFFFPFEATILLFLIAIVGAFYIGKKER